jgi:lysophospholipase L1-like esterase
MKNTFFLLTAFLLLLQLNAQAHYPVECRGSEKEYKESLNRFTWSDLKGMTVFAGSSSIVGWKNIHHYFDNLNGPKQGQNYLNRGFGGSQLCHLLIHYRKIFVGNNSDQHPKRIVIYSGENDLSNHGDPDTVIRHYDLLIQLIRRSGVKAPIDIFTIKPSPAKIHLLEIMRTTSSLMIEKLSIHKNVTVINTFETFFDSNGNLISSYYLADRLHVTNDVYNIWAKMLNNVWASDKFKKE